MWISTSFPKSRFFVSEKYAAILIFCSAVAIRVIPEAFAYPYPIGYDVVNYYIPVVENLQDHWHLVADEFPFYVVMLYLVKLATGFSAHSIVVGVATGIFGLFGVAIFYAARLILKLDNSYSIFVALFVIVQPAVLRTAWDLHRDLFSFSTMMLTFCLVSRQQKLGKYFIPTIVLAALTVSIDRMIGLLFIISVGSFAIISRSRLATILCLFSASLFAIWLVLSYALPEGAQVASTLLPDSHPTHYNPQNLFVLSAVLNGMILVPAAYGFIRMKQVLLKIPFLIALAGAFSWLVFSDNAGFVADRWIVLFGIFAAIFAGYGLTHVIKKLNARLVIAAAILFGFTAMGISYAILPYQEPFVPYAIARSYIEPFGPVTMQFNSLDIQHNDDLISTIEWINMNTENDAVIVGEKHWRGFMETYLVDQRTYRFSENPDALAKSLNERHENTYLFNFEKSESSLFTVQKVEDTNRT